MQGGIWVIVTCVTVYVKPEHIDDFIAATLENHKNSIREQGNLRFDVLQCSNDRTRFLLYEAYESEEASQQHKQTEHYLKWRDAVADFMARPREGIAHSVIAPASIELW